MQPCIAYKKNVPTLLSVLYKHEKADQVHCIVLAWMFIVKITAIIIKKYISNNHVFPLP